MKFFRVVSETIDGSIKNILQLKTLDSSLAYSQMYDALDSCPQEFKTKFIQGINSAAENANINPLDAFNQILCGGAEDDAKEKMYNWWRGFFDVISKAEVAAEDKGTYDTLVDAMIAEIVKFGDSSSQMAESYQEADIEDEKNMDSEFKFAASKIGAIADKAKAVIDFINPFCESMNESSIQRMGLEKAISLAANQGKNVLIVDNGIEGVLKKVRDAFRGRPFEAPHHTISDIGLVGSERFADCSFTKASGGCLFLWGVSKFRKNAIDALRQRLEKDDEHDVVVVAVDYIDEYGEKSVGDNHLARIQNKAEGFKDMFDAIVVGAGRVPSGSWLSEFNKKVVNEMMFKMTDDKPNSKGFKSNEIKQKFVNGELDAKSAESELVSSGIDKSIASILVKKWIDVYGEGKSAIYEDKQKMKFKRIKTESRKVNEKRGRGRLNWKLANGCYAVDCGDCYVVCNRFGQTIYQDNMCMRSACEDIAERFGHMTQADAKEAIADEIRKETQRQWDAERNEYSKTVAEGKDDWVSIDSIVGEGDEQEGESVYRTSGPNGFDYFKFDNPDDDAKFLEYAEMMRGGRVDESGDSEEIDSPSEGGSYRIEPDINDFDDTVFAVYFKTYEEDEWEYQETFNTPEEALAWIDEQIAYGEEHPIVSEVNDGEKKFKKDGEVKTLIADDKKKVVTEMTVEREVNSIYELKDMLWGQGKANLQELIDAKTDVSDDEILSNLEELGLRNLTDINDYIAYQFDDFLDSFGLKYSDSGDIVSNSDSDYDDDEDEFSESTKWKKI